MKLFESFDLVDAEDFLGVTFAYSDGKYPPHPGELNYNDIDESLPVDRNMYRKDTNSNFPKEYPCLVLLENTKTFDRTGTVKFEFLEFVYLSDFKETIT